MIKGLYATISLLLSMLVLPGVSTAEITRTHLNSDQIKKIQSVPAEEGFRFMVAGDTRDGDEVFRYFMGLAERMNAAFVIDVGDIVHSGAEKEYEQRLDLLEEFDIPYITAIGNHERHVAGGLERYRKIFGELDYYFDYGGARFVSVDNCSEKYEIRDEQIEWLDGVLDTDLIKFVFMHAPPETWLWDDSNFKT
ncbi:MAG: metallophosphoesterase, partial [bacterium]